MLSISLSAEVQYEKNGTAFNIVMSLQDQNVIKFINAHNLFPIVSMTS